MGFLRSSSETSLREAIEDYIEETPDEAASDPAERHERLLLSNILKLRNFTVVDVMIPRADIVAVNAGASQEELLALLAEKQYSRLPVYEETLDHVLGTIHIKDVLAALARGQRVDVKGMIREIPIVSPAMPVLDLIMEMRQSRRHMAMVVDEYGGIDGLVTIGDVIEAIVGEIDDEHDGAAPAQIIERPDGVIVADARVDIEEFEERFGFILSEEEREESDTLGGLVCMLAGRVPARGEILTHPSGLVFEVQDADPRRVHTLKIRKIPGRD
ncbi:MAG: hemolysin family protein [Alphaproteobacteria bacterium]|nr:hemolysin family protein [Alphaproteobacteria bacterium]